MTRLFAELYLDEDVDVLLGILLQSQGFQALTARDAGQLGQPNSQHLKYTSSHRLVVLTHNRGDFEELYRQYAAASQYHAGIIIAFRRKPHELARRVIRILDTFTTILANERTLLAYLRTALAFAAAGASLVQFFTSILSDVAGWLLMALGFLTAAIGVYRFIKTRRNLNRLMTSQGEAPPLTRESEM